MSDQSVDVDDGVDDEEEEELDEAALDDAESDPEDDFTSLVESLGLETEWTDEIPSISRTRKPQRDLATMPWEQILVKVRENPGRAMQLYIFDSPTAKAKARARAKSIRQRLFSAVPGEKWQVRAASPEPNTWGVYAMYERELTPQERDNRIAVYNSQKERLNQAREVAQGNRG